VGHRLVATCGFRRRSWLVVGLEVSCQMVYGLANLGTMAHFAVFSIGAPPPIFTAKCNSVITPRYTRVPGHVIPASGIPGIAESVSSRSYSPPPFEVAAPPGGDLDRPHLRRTVEARNDDCHRATLVART
jgi:hypothetical protein